MKQLLQYQVLLITIREDSCIYCEVKERILGVPHEILEEYTAVSEEVARQMVLGTINTIDVDFAIASTGYAGPGGGTKDNPVGTIWLAYGNKER